MAIFILVVSMVKNPGDYGTIGDVEAVIGQLEFHPEFSDPDVKVIHDRETSDHSVVSGEADDVGSQREFVVQAKGRRPTKIEITGWVAEEQLSIVDGMVSESFIGITTARWIGTAVPVNVNVNYSRVYHDKRGPIFKTTFSFLEVEQGVLPD